MSNESSCIQAERTYSGKLMEDGRRGEKVVMEWIRKRPSVLGVTDFTGIREVYEADVDVGIRLYTGQVCLAEIKSDRHLGVTGNILNEVFRINHTSPHEFAGYLGWMMRSPAKYLFFYAHQRKPPAIYVGEFAKIRKVIQSYTKRIGKNIRMDVVLTDPIKTTYNFLIPEKEYKGVFRIHEEDIPGSEKKLNREEETALSEIEPCLF